MLSHFIPSELFSGRENAVTDVSVIVEHISSMQPNRMDWNGMQTHKITEKKKIILMSAGLIRKTEYEQFALIVIL